jgi:Tol biopolymer transport system component
MRDSTTLTGVSKRSTRAAIAVLLALALPVCRKVREEPSPTPAPTPSFPPSCGPYPHRITTLKAQGGRVDWSRSNGLIAYDRLGEDGIYFDVYTMALDGSRDTCLTCGKIGLVPQRNNGNPAWHPSGNYIVFQSEVINSRVTPFQSNPGRGINNVLWVTDPSGQGFTQLTEISATDSASGVLHPHFSADGTRLSWSEMYEGAAPEPGTFFGHWRLVVADFVVEGGRPSLRNIRKYEPAQPGFYENHGFSPDGRRLLFSSNVAQTGLLSQLNNDIFSMDLGTLAITRLTTANYNEHAEHFPDGRKILWITNADVPNRGTDLWIMNPDGSGKERLTFLNQPGCSEYSGGRSVAADHSINPAGNQIVVYVQDEIFGDLGSIMLVELDRSF